MKKGQSWSLDVVIGIAVFMVAITFLFFYTGAKQESISVDQLELQGEQIADLLTNAPNQTFVVIESGNKISKRKLDELARHDYRSVKSQLGIRSDFCIYFEDAQGNLVLINESLPVVGIGSQETTVAGYNCGYT